LLGEYARVIPTEVEPVEPIAKDQLTACLMRLAERERSVILMTFYEERSGESVGASLGMSLANVRVVRHRALERLRTCMEGAA
jgi:RNA polymerase sigma-70 factor (ECF subfamily)